RDGLPIWFADGLAGFGGNGRGGVNEHRNPNAISSVDPVNEGKLDKYIPYYDEAYSGVGYKWLGKKLTRTAEEGAIHNAAVAGDNGRFTCGSGGGCHGNNAIDTLNPMNVGDRNTNAIQQVHLELTRNHILAERFSIDISNPLVAKNASGVYEFTADIKLLDKANNDTPVMISSAGIGPFGEDFDADITDAAFADYKIIGTQLGPRNLFTGYLGWMNNSPDYNQSAGKKGDDFTEIPGGAADAHILWSDGSDTGRVTVDLENIANNQWDTLKDNLSDAVGTLAVRGSLGTFPATLNLKAATMDFRFDNKSLVDGEGRQI